MQVYVPYLPFFGHQIMHADLVSSPSTILLFLLIFHRSWTQGQPCFQIMKTYNFSSSSRPTTYPAHMLLTVSKGREEANAAATGHPTPPSPDPPFTASENLCTMEVEVRYVPRTSARRILMSLAPGSPVPHSRLSTYALADSPGHPTPDQKTPSLVSPGPKNKS